MSRRTPLAFACIAAAAFALSSCDSPKEPPAALPGQAVGAESTAPGRGAAAPEAAAAPGETPVQASPVGTSPAVAGSPSGTSVAPEVAPGAAVPETAASPEAQAPAQTGPAPQPAPESPLKARRVGELVFMEGQVSVHRAGKLIQGEAVQIGMVIENYDLIVTGPKSRAELDLSAGNPGGASLKLSERTAFYFDSAANLASRDTTLMLLAGAIALKVDKLAGGSFNVVSDGATLGVRGTTFAVNTLPNGVMLVSCASGEVACVQDGGAELVAKPGQVVERRDAALSAVKAPAESLASFRSEWLSRETDSFEARALQTTRLLADRYEKARKAFDAAMTGLKSVDGILSLWEKAFQEGLVPRFGSWIEEKKRVAAALLPCVQALFGIESTFFKLADMAAREAEGKGAGSLKDGRTTEAFFASFRADSASLSASMAYARRAMLLFQYASAGSPLGSFFGEKAGSIGGGSSLIGPAD